MKSQALFIVKVLIVSAALSVAIKDVAPSLAIAPTGTNALVAVLLPTIVMAIAFILRYTTFRSAKN